MEDDPESNIADVSSKFVARYLTTKHSWKGKYKRIFSVGFECCATVNPGTWEITNKWDYHEEFVDIQPSPKNAEEFTVHLRKNKTSKKTSTTTFSSPYRSELLTHVQKYRDLFSIDSSKGIAELYLAKKIKANGTIAEVYLTPNYSCLDQLHQFTKKTIGSYDFKDITSIDIISDVPGGFAVNYGRYGRLHLFACENRDTLLKKITANAKTYIGIELICGRKTLKREELEGMRYGLFSDDDSLTSLAEFRVLKKTTRSDTAVQRLLCLTENCIIERDPATYGIVTLRPLADVFCIVRYLDDMQKFGIEYKSGAIRRYTSTDRDSLLASLLDGARASGNRDVCVRMTETIRFHRVGPWDVPVEEEIQILYLKSLGTYNEAIGLTFDQMVSRFNVNIDYSGMKFTTLIDSKEIDYITNAINSVLTLGQQSFENSPQAAAEQFECIRRIVASKTGFELFTKMDNFRVGLGKRVVYALKSGDNGLAYAAVDTLCALMQPMHDFYDLVVEQLNKKSLMSSRGFLTQLSQLLGKHAASQTGALVVAALLDFFTYALCEPFSKTTEQQNFDLALELISDLGRKMFKLFQHSSMAIVKGSGLLMRAIIEEAPQPVLEKMQILALSEGALLKQIHTATFTRSTDQRLLTHRELARQLVSLWCDGNPPAQKLLKSIFPVGLIQYLQSTEIPPAHESINIDVRGSKAGVKAKKQSTKEVLMGHWKNRSFFNSEKEAKPLPRQLVVRQKVEREREKGNWLMFYYQLSQDHCRTDLIWNHRTREELREGLESEMRAFNIDKELGGTQALEISWNYLEFEIKYESLAEELKIGDNYVRLLLEQGLAHNIANPTGFFFDLYHRFLLTQNRQMKLMCLQAMAIVYGYCHPQIGPFADTLYIVGMLGNTNIRAERDRLLIFLDKLLLVRDNTKAFIDGGGVRLLVDLLTLSHLHVERAVTPLQTNLIEAGDMKRQTEREWYTIDAEKNKKGPFSPEELKDQFAGAKINGETKCWAQGMDGWRPLKSVAQLKWTITDTGPAVINESEVANYCLSMLNRLCDMYPSRDIDGAVVRPLPRVKRMLSEPTCLPHLVNIFLTFDPMLVEKTSTLLYNIMQDNPVIPRLFLTGAFLFAMMYTGSNVLPLAKFLYVTHNKQAFRSEEEEEKTASTRESKSILAPLLPKAMICFLENYGPEKFAEVFLGNFDTPEAIWNHEMRRFMIEKISVHISEYTPRLLSNTHAMYQYCPMPTINYPALEHELFCNIYYLRNLCNISKYPDWPIKNQIELLKDCLDAWKREVEKKPPPMSVEDAYTVLGLEKGKSHEESAIRKSYFKLANKYHPDKNPDGREMFEKVNKAYEFLSSSQKMKMDGPDPENIVLILRAQSILFKRFPEILQPYKYAGYPMLIKTIEMETADDRLFAKAIPLLPAACELAYYTVKVSALNAEELRRENGIEVVAMAFSRCIDVISPKTNPQETSVQVCTHLVYLFGAAAQFEKCREMISQNLSIIKNLCRCLHFKGAPLLTIGSLECVSSFAVDSVLQDLLIQSGCLWHLLLLLFGYDYTLHESGVEASVESNEQEGNNHNAKLAVRALARMGGYLPSPLDTPANQTVQKALEAMITHYLCRQLALDNPVEMLKLFTMNTENPYLIWNNGTRAELMEFVEKQQTKALRGTDQDPTFGTSFTFSDLNQELVVGHIYVRIYNKAPNFPLEDANQFTLDLLQFLRQEGECLFRNPPNNDPQSLRPKSLVNSRMALEALSNVIVQNPGVEKHMLGKFKMLFFFLRVDDDHETQKNALKVIQAVSVSKDCVNGIADAGTLGNLLMLCHSLPTHHDTIVETLLALATNQKIVAEAIVKGGVIYLLDLFCISQNPAVRIGAASIFSKMCADKLHGPRVAIILSKFLPPIFHDAMRENAEASVHMYETNHENPELVWDDDARQKVQSTVSEMKVEFFKEQLVNPNAKWDIPPNFEVVYTTTAGEVVVGGVYLKLFTKQPGWSLRNPKQFMVSLFDKYFELAQGNPGEHPIVTVGDAIVLLLTVQSQLPAYAASIGLIAKLFAVMNSKNEFILKTSCQIVHALSGDSAAVEAMSGTKSVEPMMNAIKAYPRSLEVMGEALKKIYERHNPERGTMIKQALECKLVPFLLNLLQDGLNDVEHVSAVKAQIVGALKAMAGDITLGPQINAVLSESTVWNAYKDQRHDLFLTNTTTRGYLTGPVTATKGYLTAGPSTMANLSSVPPPDDE